MGIFKLSALPRGGYRGLAALLVLERWRRDAQTGAYPLSVPRGSPVAATTVHWWIDAASFDSYPNYFTYTFAVRIVGPNGVPDGVARP
jgi:hypothetical protein